MVCPNPESMPRSYQYDVLSLIVSEKAHWKERHDPYISAFSFLLRTKLKQYNLRSSNWLILKQLRPITGIAMYDSWIYYLHKVVLYTIRSQTYELFCDIVFLPVWNIYIERVKNIMKVNVLTAYFDLNLSLWREEPHKSCVILLCNDGMIWLHLK